MRRHHRAGDMPNRISRTAQLRSTRSREQAHRGMRELGPRFWSSNQGHAGL